MALTLMILLVNRWAYQVFFVFESEWIWCVERTPLADSFAQDGLAVFVAMHIAALVPGVQSIGWSR